MANATRVNAKSALPLDAYVGARIRMRRGLLGLSQSDLGTALGITFQQVQKYENGTNRVGASRLQQIADILQVPVGWFFEGQPGSAGSGDARRARKTDLLYAAFMRERLAPRLMRAFPHLPLPVKQALVDVAEAALQTGGRRKGLRIRALPWTGA
jgi:transcriptional regulator with XRE-family HTH domain